MRVLNIPGGADTGGNGFRTLDAFRRLAPEWTYDLCVSTMNYMQYPGHRRWGDAPGIWDRADVVHLRNNFEIERVLRVEPRPAIVQHHGTFYRTNHNELRAEIHKRGNVVSVVSTLDLWLIAPDESEWLPAPYDLSWLASWRSPIEDGRLRIGHAPTDRRIKSTDKFLDAVDRLRRDVDVELVLIENASWSDCLKGKGACDIYFDQAVLGYGNNSIEAWGMGIPVIAGAQDLTLSEMERRFGSLPFYRAEDTPESIYGALLALADPQTRAEWGQRGLEHVRRWHDDARVVEHLKALYTRAYEAGS